MPRSRLLVPALIIALALGLAACGGDGGGSDDESQITDAIEADATGDDPSNCTELQTQRFTEQTTGETGEAAIKSCEDSADEGNADSVEVSNVEVDGDTATADAGITGSVLDGQTIQIGLVNEGDQWKLDELLGFTDFDLDAIADAFADEVASSGGITPEQASCVAGQFRSLSEQEAQDFFLDPGTAAFQRIFGPCQG